MAFTAVRVHSDGFSETSPEEDDAARKQRQYELKAIKCAKTAIEAYKTYEQGTDNTDISYYRGRGWAERQGAPTPQPLSQAGQRSTQDEIYPAIDAMKSAMSMDNPQVSATDKRYNRTLDPVAFQQGRMVASTLCWFSDKDSYGAAVSAAVLNALVFNRGGIFKAFPDVESGLIRWRVLEPWEIHFDPRAKRLEDVAWSVELVTMSLDEFKDHIESGVYSQPKKEVKGDVVSMQLDQQGQDQLLRQDAEVLKRQPWEEVLIWEWRDYRRNKMMHIVAQTEEVVLDTPITYGMPYRVLIYDSAIGSLSGISIVDRMVTLQRDINELSNVRLEVARRNFAKLFVLAELFQNDEEYNNWLRARPWEPCKVSKPDSLQTLQEGFYVQPAPGLSSDFHTDVEQRTGHARYIAGAGEFRGKSGFRTAEEAAQVAGDAQGRMESRMNAVIRCVREMFEVTLRILQWMLQGIGTPGFDYDPMPLYRETQGDGVSYEEWREAIMNASAWLKIEPFAPLMENAQTRRAALVQLLQALAGIEPLAQCFNWKVLAEEIVRLYKFNPDAATPPAAPAEAGVPPEGGAMPPELPPPVPSATMPPPATPAAGPMSLLASLGAGPGGSNGFPPG